MNTVISHNYTGKSLVVVYVDETGTHTKIIEESHPNWRLAVAFYTAGDWPQLIPALDIAGAIALQFTSQNFTARDGKVYFKGNEVGGYLIERLLFFMREIPHMAPRLEKFAENLYSNPSPRVIEELYRFLEHKNMPITEDGCFLAYKGVGADYFSRTSGGIEVLKGKVKDGRIFNGVGEHIVVARAQVCDDKSQGCAQGLHVGSWEYADGFKGDGHLMVVKVNPKDAVSVPDDCNWQKLRACAYTVVAEDGAPLHEVKDADYDQQAPRKFNRDSLGRFSKYCRDAKGRFVAQQ